MHDIQIIIMAGGVGSRFWGMPISELKSYIESKIEF